MRKLNLEDLTSGNITGLSSSVSAFLYESALYTLVSNNHQSGIKLEVKGDFEEVFELEWSGVLTKEIAKNWLDKKEAVEYAATAIAFLLLEKLTDYCFFSRAVQSDLADYLLNKKGNSTKFEEGNPFAYLEVSGIWKASSSNSIDMRISAKQRRLELQNEYNFPYFIIVTEFGQPITKIKKNE